MSDKDTTREGFSDKELEWNVKNDERYVDHMTGLFNRKYFDEKLAGLEGTDRSLLLIDMDGLKQANDLTGSHTFGDRMLKQIGDEMLLLTREREGSDPDVACRIGGDEFGIIFSNKLTAEQLSRIASRLNGLVNSHIYNVPDKKIEGVRVPIKLSVSIGGAVATPEMSKETLFDNADSALYKSKEIKNSASIFGLKK